MTRSRSSFLSRSISLAVAALLAASCATASFAQTSNTTATAKVTTPVDVNSADQKTLQTLSGVGSATAKKIIAGRPYQNISDLGKIKGLTAAKLSAIKDRLVFGPALTAATNTAKASTPKPAATPAAAPAAATATPAPKATASTLAPGQMMNINTASAADLDKIPGIGPVKAKAIIDYRTQNGDFKSIDDIQKVKGIKAGTFAKIKAYLKVND